MNEEDYILKKFNLAGGKNPQTLKGISRPSLFDLFRELGYKNGCEVGLEKGKNAQEMFEHIPDLHLYGVDPYRQHAFCSYIETAMSRRWDNAYLQRVKEQAMGRLGHRNFTLLEDFSEEASKQIEDNSLDFVYIDGDHSYDFVMMDVIIWGRKVRKGGIISGHDYYYDNNKEGRRAKVTHAINDYTKVHGINFFITDEDHYVLRGDKYPSWLWVKKEDIFPNYVG